MARRTLTLSLLSLCTLGACKHAPEMHAAGPILQMVLDDGHATERPLTPSKTFELLMRFDPGLPAYLPRRMWLQLAQPGHITVSIYGTTRDGNPGDPLYSVERVYDPLLISNGSDGKWVIEELDLPAQHAPIWVGLHSPGGGNDPRLWASSNDSGSVYMRDPDPSTPLSSTKIPRTPLLRIEFSPEDPALEKPKHKK